MNKHITHWIKHAFIRLFFQLIVLHDYIVTHVEYRGFNKKNVILQHKLLKKQYTSIYITPVIGIPTKYFTFYDKKIWIEVLFYILTTEFYNQYGRNVCLDYKNKWMNWIFVFPDHFLNFCVRVVVANIQINAWKRDVYNNSFIILSNNIVISTLYKSHTNFHQCVCHAFPQKNKKIKFQSIPQKWVIKTSNKCLNSCHVLSLFVIFLSFSYIRTYMCVCTCVYERLQNTHNTSVGSENSPVVLFFVIYAFFFYTNTHDDCMKITHIEIIFCSYSFTFLHSWKW